jgi:hypothetical protein
MASPGLPAGVAPQAQPRGHIKGAAFREFLAWYGRTQGQDALLSHLAAMPPALASELDPRKEALGVLASQWYPAEVVHALLDEIARGRSPAELEAFTNQASRAVMQATLSGLYRVLFEWMATPARYARYAPKLWSSYYDSGQLSIEFHEGEATAVSTVSRWPGHHPLICDLNRGASPAIYAAMGCKDARCTRVACVSRGDDVCRFVTTWRGR